MVQYDVVVGQDADPAQAARLLAAEVNARMASGWALVGGSYAMSHGSQAVLYQPMVKLAPAASDIQRAAFGASDNTFLN